MFENYMDYTPDSCKNLFTQDQSARMNAVLSMAPYNALVTSTACTAPTGIHNLDMEHAVDIFPNPTSGNFIITFIPVIKSGVVEFYNALGERILSDDINNESKKEINLKNTSDGIYFVRVFDENK